MARTILRDRSDDLVRSVQLADRTGIVAASAPKPVATHGDDEPIAAEFAPAAGQLDLVLESVVGGVPTAGDEGRLLRRVRRNLLVAAAAVVLLGVGWIAGGTFGFGHGSDTEPAVAAGMVPNAGPAEPMQPAPSASPAPQAPVTTTEPPAAPSTKKVTPPVQRKVTPTETPSSDRGEPRNNPVETEQGTPLGRAVDEQIQELFEVWTWNQTGPRGDFDEKQDRSVRSFGPLGR